jgi:hypothetical protein
MRFAPIPTAGCILNWRHGPPYHWDGRWHADAQADLATIRAGGMGTEMHRGINGTRAAVGRGARGRGRESRHFGMRGRLRAGGTRAC